MKYTIRHACGHEATAQFYGTQKSRDWQVQRQEGELCPPCWAKQQVEASRAAGDAAVRAVAESGAAWPALTGSEKQVEWATQIRAKMVVWVASADAARVLGALVAPTRKAIATITSAAWYCDRSRAAPDHAARSAVGYLAATQPRLAAEMIGSELAVYELDRVEAEREERGGDAVPTKRLARELSRIIAIVEESYDVTRTARREPHNVPVKAVLHDAWQCLVVAMRREIEGRGIDLNLDGWEDVL